MRGLAFPPNASVERQASYESGTPISNVDDIPIHPALAEAAIDPALMVEENATCVPQIPQQEIHYFQHQPPPPDDYQVRQYSQGPQGDPFAPQIAVPYFPIEQQQPTPPPKPKRKRRVRREEECSFCQGNDTRNKLNEPESMITCVECGRSGHPSCMELEKQAEVMRSYQWKCIECKNCELCQEKGDDERILFCDWCDRGWHLDCMNPPLENPPEGAWHCPACPPLIPGDEEPSTPQPHDAQQSPLPSGRETSVASTSRSVVEVLPLIRGRGRKKGSGRGRGAAKAVASDDSDGCAEQEVQETPIISRPRVRSFKSATKAKARVDAVSSDEEPATFPTRGLKRKRGPRQSSPAAPLPRVRLRLTAPRGKGKEREVEEPPHGLFDDILGVQERDTTKTTIMNMDKQFFERSRLAAEHKLAPPPLPPPPTTSSSRHVDHEISTPLHSRPLRSATLQHLPTIPNIDFSNSPGPSTPGGPLPKFEPGVLRIRTIRFGQFDIKTWYDAPFPEEYASIPDGRLWICEFCLKYMKSRFGALRHQMKCKARHPPGDEIYRDGSVSIFEVDGRRNKIYCQNLCLLSKMFLDHKSLFYDVEPFLFYVITEVDEFGARFVGYFSKEKRCPKDYNLSCIMTLPVRQRQGWGNLLIDFSYLLSKIEQRQGSPEKPLSGLGALGYKNYWTLAIMRFLELAPDNVRLEDISSATSMTIEDVCTTLIQQNMIFIRETSLPHIKPSPGQAIKFPKGRKNGIARKQLQRMQTQDKDPDGMKGPFVVPKNYEIHFDRQKVETYVRTWEAKGYLQLKPEKLQWTPYIVTRNTKEAAITSDLPAMDTVVDEPSKVQPVMNGRREEPVTPAPVDAMIVDSPIPVEEIEDDELPTVHEVAALETRSRRRSSMKSPSKESSQSQRTPRARSIASLPPAPRSLRSGRSSQAQLASPSLSVMDDEAISVRSTRSRPGRPSRKADMAIDDEGLAAKLATEEQMQSRQLRSRRSESRLERKPAATPVATPNALPGRKRRRVESSPELEESPSPRPPPTPEPEEVTPPSTNGRHLNGDADSAMVIDSPKINGHHNGHATQEQHHFKIPPPDLLNGIIPVDVINASRPPTKGDVVVKEVVRNHELDVKSEDAGTPLTNLTSRKSLPSDDTVFMTDIIHPSDMNKPSNNFTEFHGTVHAESDLRSTLEPSEKALVHQLVDLEECHDEDADGEYDDDAEGEPDDEYYS